MRSSLRKSKAQPIERGRCGSSRISLARGELGDPSIWPAAVFVGLRVIKHRRKCAGAYDAARDICRIAPGRERRPGT